MIITIQLTEKQLKLLEPLRVLTVNGADENKLGMVIAQIALDDFSSIGFTQRGECKVTFIPNKLAIELIDTMKNFKVNPLDK